LALSSALLLTSLPALADEGAPGVPSKRTGWREDAEAHCNVVKGTADAERALLMAPQIFGSVGMVNSGELSTGAATMPPTLRLTVGASYSGAGLHRSFLLEDRANAECARQRVVAQLRAFLASAEDGLVAHALSAKLAVIRASLPRAEAILDATRLAFANARATAGELNATELRVNALKSEAEQARQGIESAALDAPPPSTSLPDLLHAHAAAEEKVERCNAALRLSYGWDVSVRGGYDRIFGTRSSFPLFGMITVTVNPGMIFQGGPNARAVAGRRAFASAEVKGDEDRAQKLVQKLRATRSGERARLSEAAVLLADLKERMASAEAIGGEKAKSYVDHLWFEVVELEAETAYLRAHERDLGAALGESAEGG
jgi:hypothetical protein